MQTVIILYYNTCSAERRLAQKIDLHFSHQMTHSITSAFQDKRTVACSAVRLSLIKRFVKFLNSMNDVYLNVKYRTIFKYVLNSLVTIYIMMPVSLILAFAKLN